MATPLDLEEQEQLDQLKHFWATYGNLITWTLLLVAGAFMAWNGWNYFQRSKAAQAAVLYDQVEQAASAGDLDRLDRAFSDMKAKFDGTSFAQQAGLKAAEVQYEKGKTDQASASLEWVAEHGIDPGFQAVAKLRLAGLLLDEKAYDKAIERLNGSFPTEFEGLVADRKGDVYKLQGQRDAARAEYEKAYQRLAVDTDLRRLVAIKLNAVGVDPASLAGGSLATVKAPS